MRKSISLMIVLFITVSFISVNAKNPNSGVLFQTAIINSLLEGIYDGETTIKELKKHGNFGIGTFNNLDGEMIVLDGNVYQVKADGVIYMPKDSVKTPFAAVTDYKADYTFSSDDTMDVNGLQKLLTSKIKTKNIFYAFRIDGVFNNVKTRSVPAQTDKPYKILAEVVKNQSIFEAFNIEGTVIGLYCPSYVGGINVPGFHLHFLSKDKKFGGHILQLETKKINTGIASIHGFNMILPENDDFNKVDLSKDKEAELKKIEK